MPLVVPVKFTYASRDLWFDPQDLDILEADYAICSTERGTEIGLVTADPFEVPQDEIGQPLKPVLRVASDIDLQLADDLAIQGDEAMVDFRRLVKELDLEMKPVGVEYLFGGEKAVFYFAAEERVDFRQLVKDLSSTLHIRVDMRQIGVRDEARLAGGYAPCGQELCCVRFGGQFQPVSIRMAKEQDLPLNSSKISGVCGRLMCCLRYEYETYKEVNSRAPKHGAKVEVPGGVARVTEINVPLERVTLQLEDGKSIKVPLSEMEYNGEGKRPTGVSEEVFEKYASPDPLDVFGATTFEVASFSGNEKLADNESRKARKSEREKEDAHRKPRRRRSRSGSSGTEGQSANKGEGSQDQKKSASQKKNEGQSRRTRRGSGKGSKPQQQGKQGQQNQRSDERKKNNSDQGAKRPGRKSSGVRNAPRKQQGEHTANGSNAGKQGEVAHRKPRRRRRKAQGEGSTNEQQ